MTLETMDIDPKRKRYIIDILNPVLEEAVGALIAAEPAEPADFLMTQFLGKLGGDVPSMPDDPPELVKNRELKAALAALKEDMRKAIVVNVQLQQNQAGGDEEKKAADDDEEEEEDDEDIPEPPQVTRTGNRQSVSAEAYGDWNKQNKTFVPPVYEKTEEQMTRIRDILDKSFIFTCVDDKQQEVLLKAMNKVTLKPEDKVITEGDAGDFLFVVDEGKLICYKESIGEGTVLKTCVGGDIFGELALLYNCPRAASVKAKADCLLWKLDRDTFNNIVVTAADKKRQQSKDFLAKVPLLEGFDAADLSNLSDVLVPKKMRKDQEVVKQGDEGDEFYIVEEGGLVALKDGTQVMEYKPGDYFGELALLNASSGVRQATIKATSDSVRLLSLKRDAFKRMLGNLEEILKKRANAYT